MPSSASILNLDAQENEGDTIPRSMPFGIPAAQGERIKVPELYNRAFYHRVNVAVEQLKQGIPAEEVRLEHGMIVLRAALDKAGDVDPMTGEPAEERQRGRPKVIVPCPWCGHPFDGRGMASHKISCMMKPKRR